MDIGNITGWIQLAIWIVGTALFIGRSVVRWKKGEDVLPAWLRKTLSSNAALGVIIFLGLVLSIVTQYLNYTYNHQTLLEGITISAYQEGVAMKVVRDQTFENESVPLDGHIYDHCVFINACLLYDGGPYQLQNATFRDHWKICVKEQPLKNYSELGRALQLYRRGVKHSQKTVMKQ